MNWLGLCEETNPDITAVRSAMLKVLPRQMKLCFFVIPQLESKAQVEKYFTFLYRNVKPKAVILNSDIGMFPVFELYNEFLQATSYIGKLDLDLLYVVDQNYEKKIIRDNQFDWYSKPYQWSDEIERP